MAGMWWESSVVDTCRNYALILCIKATCCEPIPQHCTTPTSTWLKCSMHEICKGMITKAWKQSYKNMLLQCFIKWQLGSHLLKKKLLQGQYCTWECIHFYTQSDLGTKCQKKIKSTMNPFKYSTNLNFQNQKKKQNSNCTLAWVRLKLH